MPVIVNALQNLPAELKTRYSRNLVTAGNFYKGEVEKVLHNFHGAGVHSLPGDSPNWQTGVLANSLYVEIKNLEMKVKSSARYSKYLERGTPRMAARPFAGPVWQTHAATIRRIILTGK